MAANLSSVAVLSVDSCLTPLTIDRRYSQTAQTTNWAIIKLLYCTLYFAADITAQLGANIVFEMLSLMAVARNQKKNA